ncbi:chromosomal replication initiator protein DnaA [Prochlorothrix hollandica]|uniref:Chromosomal replication initiator protein DnaA n=1 Tax=Prochlorothrix hollandica PCC 9006 = CALU 1027 TaxID=317619 RepID=A0A0M2PZZ0_PROHO|nr:chromosomal replication initiator protein DnaA [Prochlorothrix hollandica]KKJ00259.1 chromosomal replication initiation protein [Prochlorothrix hollandica PCC 9006 = CALU 1027]
MSFVFNQVLIVDISPQQLWDQVLDRLQTQLSRPTFETWIKTATVEEMQGNCLHIRTPNPFARKWLEKYYAPAIATALEELVGEPIALEFTIAHTAEADAVVQGESLWTPVPGSSGEEENGGGLAPDPQTRGREPGAVPTDQGETQGSGAEANSMTPLGKPVLRSGVFSKRPNELNPKYLFSRFVVGSNNRMGHAASLAVAESPGREFNPLFLCGGVGLGKTHLMQAIGHYRLEVNPDAKIFYVSTEKFTNDLITAIRHDGMQDFRDHYRAADVLLVDDIQFIEGKEYTQEEFFYTFNTLHEAGKQVVLAADRPPNQIPRLQERLCSRFSMGLIADIQLPDLETRMAILQKKAEYENIRLPRDVIEYVASRYTSNIRELEGALTRAVAYTSISGLSMTVENISPVLNPSTNKVEVSPETILAVVAETFGIAIEEIKGNSRRREISLARQVGMYLMRHYTDLSLPKIGEAFGGKDHTTVLYSCDKILQQKSRDSQLGRTLQDLCDRLVLSSKGEEG